MDCIDFSYDLVMYDIGKEYTAVGSRDSDWTFRPIHIENARVPASAQLRAKYHNLWDQTEVRGRTQATNSCETNMYVSKMLALFQGELKSLWSQSQGRAAELAFSKRRNTHALSCALKAGLQSSYRSYPIGSLPRGEAPWLVCEHKPDGFNIRYIHDYHFEDSEPSSDPWSKLIHAFCHFTFERSDYRTMICQLDCDGEGVITSVECYQRRTPNYRQKETNLGETIHRAFWHFTEDHQCNNICYDLGLTRLKVIRPAHWDRQL
ncbi:hypothetical protein DFH28DRAFT_906322 [Melampsora americana]|nr:hypothetical protein DFH28DRAFT_906322 [Melampsora americana]